VLASVSALAYYDAYRSARLPANLTQAQRDYFGAHTFQRSTKKGRSTPSISVMTLIVMGVTGSGKSTIGVVERAGRFDPPVPEA
jgi:hypothetical protein